MKFLSLGLLLPLVSATKYDFSPEISTVPYDPKQQALLYDPGESQLYTGATSSYWTCSFITASDNHQYMVLGHTMYTNGFALARSSILDVTDPSYYKMYLYSMTGVNASSNNGVFDATVGSCSIHGVSDDNVSIMSSHSENEESTYNITYEATSRLLFNGGLGKFTLGTGPCGEWSVPAGKTYGTLNIRGEELTIDSDNSFTWYDRQWGDGTLVNGNYTWFQIHVPKRSIRASIWIIDDYHGQNTTKIATFRFPDGSHSILPFEFQPSAEDMYTSSDTGITYPTHWLLNFPGHGSIDVRSIRADQETHNITGDGIPAYEGFSDVQFNLFGYNETGFGLAELVKSG